MPRIVVIIRVHVRVRTLQRRAADGIRYKGLDHVRHQRAIRQLDFADSSNEY